MPPQDHSRVTATGRALGAQLVRLTDPAIFQLSLEGEPDTRCASCAFKLGTVPNGCEQTQLDAVKAVMEGVPFYCHMDPQHRTLCHGWFAGRYAVDGRRTVCPWEFSPPDAKE
jgi:hypothetical protein